VPTQELESYLTFVIIALHVRSVLQEQIIAAD